jgi:hypothetical protein
MLESKELFLKEFKDLLEKYNVSLSFNLGECCDTHGFYDERMVIRHTIKKGSWQEEEWLSVDGWSIYSNDIEIPEE